METTKPRRLTKKQKDFANEYLKTGNATRSALAVYDTVDENTAHVIGSENLRKPTIQDYLTDKAERAAEIVFQIAEHGESDVVRLNASKDILDRAGYKAVEKRININLEAEDVDPRIAELARKMNYGTDS